MGGLLLELESSFTDEDKEECKPTIRKLVKLANLLRQSGISDFAAELKEEESIFLKTAVGLIAQGTDPNAVKTILRNLIITDGFTGSRLLERLLIVEGILSMQAGEHPKITEWKLLSMLGEQHIPLSEILVLPE